MATMMITAADLIFFKFHSILIRQPVNLLANEPPRHTKHRMVIYLAVVLLMQRQLYDLTGYSRFLRSTNMLLSHLDGGPAALETAAFVVDEARLLLLRHAIRLKKRKTTSRITRLRTDDNTPKKKMKTRSRQGCRHVREKDDNMLNTNIVTLFRQ